MVKQSAFKNFFFFIKQITLVFILNNNTKIEHIYGYKNHSDCKQSQLYKNSKTQKCQLKKRFKFHIIPHKKINLQKALLQAIEVVVIMLTLKGPW